MVKLLVILWITLLVSFSSFDLDAQKTKLITKSINEVDNKLVINYDFIKSRANQKFDVTLEISGSSGNLILVKSLSGDVGKNVTGGPDKQIIWDFNADGIVLQDKIDIEIFAEPIIDETTTTKPVSTGKALLLSTVLPGLGISKIENGKPYWIMGIAAYGTLGFSYISNKKAQNEYEDYLANTDENLNDELLNDSQSQYSLSKTMAYTAIGIWCVSLVWTAIKAGKANRQISLLQKNKKINFYAGYDPVLKTTNINLKFRF